MKLRYTKKKGSCRSFLSLKARLLLCYAIVYVGWGTTYLALRFSVEDFPVFPGMFLRFGVAATVLFIALAVGGRSLRISRRELVGASLVGIFCYGIAIPLDGLALREVPSGIACIVLGLTPVVLAFAEYFFFHRQLRRGELIGGVIAVLGVTLLAMGNGSGSPISLTPRGMTLLLAGIAFWCAGTVTAKKVPLPANAGVSTAYQLGAGAAFAVVVLLAKGTFPNCVVSGWTLRVVVSILYLSVIGSVVVITAYNWLLRNQPITRVATHMFVNPVVAVLIGFLWGGEPSSPLVILALTVTLAGTAIALKAK